MSDFNKKYNRVVWFDLPVSNLLRASKFYAKVLNIQVQTGIYEGTEFGILAHEEGNGGCLVPCESEITATQGPLIYLNVEGRIKEAVQAVVKYGGIVQQETHAIGPHGFRALIIDSEGNKIALHSESN